MLHHKSGRGGGISAIWGQEEGITYDLNYTNFLSSFLIPDHLIVLTGRPWERNDEKVRRGRENTRGRILRITIDTQSINSNSSCHFFLCYLLLIE